MIASRFHLFSVQTLTHTQRNINGKRNGSRRRRRKKKMFRTSNDTTNSHYICGCVSAVGRCVFRLSTSLNFHCRWVFLTTEKLLPCKFGNRGLPRICTDKYTMKSYNGSQNGLGASMGWMAGPFCPQCNCCVH